MDDPSAPIYDRMFEQHPEFTKMFRLNDTNGDLARKNMFQVAVVALMEHLEGKNSSINMVNSERTNHAHIGVDNATFDSYYSMIRDSFKEILGDEWSDETQAAWDEAIESLTHSTQA